ncbi:fluoride efflux transporter FluC [Halobellus clavatus]|jgi:CrcB protein|uniref:Fluoride-specific ion channel FluC n=1 Tax=Halobellus clavatus TaxID=660517 RepID=A0A1H3GCP4_9EURY|nr:CrcB family protein [Halobellus clavatus]SDY01122.1 CrcB protein [Halobellus clavatus]
MTDRLVPLLVAVGGFVGAACRYAVGVAVPGPDAAGTLAVNVLGSFALAASVSVVRSRRFRYFLATGMLSSFTTYSTFAVQTASLGSAWGLANIGANYALGFAAALAGLRLGRRFA